jgi:PAS domain S-box-containing protein
MAKNNNTLSERYTIIWVGFLVGLGFYIADIILDVFVFRSGTLNEEFLHPTHHETWMRVTVFILAVTFAIYVQIILRRVQEASNQVKTAESFLSSVFDNIPGMVFIKDGRDLRFIRINRAGEKLLGHTTQELMGKSDYDLFPEVQAEYFTRKDREVLESGIELDIPEEEIDTATQGKRWLHTRKVPIFDEEGQPIYLLGISEDITETKQTEEELQRQQRDIAHVMRLCTMGEMASGLAHELNQPLTALTSYCGTAAMLVRSLPSPPQQLGEMLRLAEKQAHRASSIIRHLREFISKTDAHDELVNIDLVIEKVIDLMNPELKIRQVRIEHHAGALDNKIMVNKTLVEQVLVNLMLNSMEAITDSGKATGNIIVQTRLLPNEVIETTVTDDGPGIDADIAGRMFDPFQSNKPTGMGMGLSISRSIVEAYGGKLWADVQRGNGAQFGFNLPACK